MKVKIDSVSLQDYCYKAVAYYVNSIQENKNGLKKLIEQGYETIQKWNDWRQSGFLYRIRNERPLEYRNIDEWKSSWYYRWYSGEYYANISREKSRIDKLNYMIELCNIFNEVELSEEDLKILKPVMKSI